MSVQSACDFLSKNGFKILSDPAATALVRRALRLSSGAGSGGRSGKSFRVRRPMQPEVGVLNIGQQFPAKPVVPPRSKKRPDRGLGHGQGKSELYARNARLGLGVCKMDLFVSRARYAIRSPSCADTLTVIGAVITVWSAYADVVLAWLATIVVGGLIYFFPLGQFLQRFGE
jgi:hypothetical protein